MPMALCLLPLKLVLKGKKLRLVSAQNFRVCSVAMCCMYSPKGST